ncbi:MAG: GNAT family N-acetyltransferase [Oscillospiraceae bacterium]|nr:GNAT family N-acetyltransferase [Oscillospiraceae bacterium]
MDGLTFVDACTDRHFADMSLIHALGWRDTYVDAVPAAWMAEHITDDRWVPLFRADWETGRCRGLLLYRGDTPVSCINYGPARVENYNAGSACTFDTQGYEGWGEIISFYTHPEERGKGYGGLLFEEAVRRLQAEGYPSAFVFVLRENEKGRRFYAHHGFVWDGTHADIPFPPDTVCVDLRYVKKL